MKRELKEEVKEKEKLNKILQNAEAERLKSIEGLNNEKTTEKVKKLMSFDKQKLAEEVVKAMMDL